MELTKKQIVDKELTIDWNMQVYYDPKTSILFTVRRQGKEIVVIGGLCGYYDDAITSLARYLISQKYFTECLPITRDSNLLVKDENGYLKVKGYNTITNNFCYHNVRNNPEFTYLLKETDKLVNTFMKRE